MLIFFRNETGTGVFTVLAQLLKGSIFCLQTFRKQRRFLIRI